MRLDELPWEEMASQIDMARFGAAAIIWRVTINNHVPAYTIRSHRIDPKATAWINLDPIAAQAIVYHLLNPEGNES